MNMLSSIKALIPVSEELSEKLTAISSDIDIKKGDNIILEGDKCNELFFINKGLLRGYYLIDGKEITNWIGQEGEFGTCFYSFIAQKPSTETIQGLEDSILTKISYNKLQSLFTEFPETERIGRLIIENYYVKLEERLLSIQFKTAKERYLHLLENKPSLLNRVPLGHIATYLGISQETLSRMRAQL